jgi:hypothetical protein
MREILHYAQTVESVPFAVNYYTVGKVQVARLT